VSSYLFVSVLLNIQSFLFHRNFFRYFSTAFTPKKMVMLQVIMVVIMIRNRKKKQNNYEQEQVMNSAYIQSTCHSSF